MTAIEEKRQISEETLADYLYAAEELDTVLEALTRDFCADDCIKGEYGCCKENMCYSGFFQDLVALAGQREEATERGWMSHDNKCCDYLIPEKGCALRLFKPPVCIGNLCDDIENAMGKSFSDKDLVFNFTSHMEAIAFGGDIRSTDGYISNSAKAMLEAASLGRRLIAMVPAGYTPAEYIREMSKV